MLAPTQTKNDSSRAFPTRRTHTRFLITLLLGAMIVSAWKLKVTGQPPFLHRESVWSIARYSGASPFTLHPTSCDNVPVLTAADVTDVEALFVADPFLVRNGELSYLFVEVLNRATHHGDIGVAVSHDQGVSWRYQEIVLDEDWHLSYPMVFSWQARWYMVPQSNRGVQLYEAESFPGKWRRVATLLTGEDRADATLFRHMRRRLVDVRGTCRITRPAAALLRRRSKGSVAENIRKAP